MITEVRGGKKTGGGGAEAGEPKFCLMPHLKKSVRSHPLSSVKECEKKEKKSNKDKKSNWPELI